MKIKVFHTECGREAFVQQILETGGHCPWDGKPYNKDYTAVLAEALEAAQDSGSVLKNALEKIAEMHPALTIDRPSMLGDIEGNLRLLNDRRAAPRT